MIWPNARRPSCRRSRPSARERDARRLEQRRPESPPASPPADAEQPDIGTRCRTGRVRLLVPIATSREHRLARRASTVDRARSRPGANRDDSAPDRRTSSIVAAVERDDPVAGLQTRPPRRRCPAAPIRRPAACAFRRRPAANPTRIRNASRKLVTGPASTISARCHTGLAWNVRARSSAASASQSGSGWLAGFMSPANWT